MMKGLELTRVFEEPGVSGAVPLEERPAGGELVASLRSGDWLIVAKLDRAFRGAADALTKAEAWKKQGVKLIVADMGVDPVTDNGVSKMFFGMLALVAEFERDRIRDRVTNGRTAKKARGGHIGGAAPFGFRVEGEGKEAQLVPVPEQQVALVTIRALCRGGVSSREIAREVERTHGLKVSHATVRKICRDAGAPHA
jgi:DNA invertase Pin-like site-specific DNA recombinase